RLISCDIYIGTVQYLPLSRNPPYLFPCQFYPIFPTRPFLRFVPCKQYTLPVHMIKKMCLTGICLKRKGITVLLHLLISFINTSSDFGLLFNQLLKMIAFQLTYLRVA